jgi:RNA polymerase sigma factor (TIGR02999 family)
MDDVTQIFHQIEKGDAAAAGHLLPLVYEELRKLASLRLQQEKPGQTLQATALVHEAYLRLVDSERATHWESRGHFFAAAAEAMRRILVENARQKRQIKRGRDMTRHPLEEAIAVDPETNEDLVALDVALDRLKDIDAQAVKLVQLRYFAGLPIVEAAELLGVSPRTADRLWAFARAWLRRELADMEDEPAPN